MIGFGLAGLHQQTQIGALPYLRIPIQVVLQVLHLENGYRHLVDTVD